MASSKSAIKRARQNSIKETRNTSQISKMRSSIKNFRLAVETGEENSNELFTKAIKEIDISASKGLIHANKANRDKSKLASLLAN